MASKHSVTPKQGQAQTEVQRYRVMTAWFSCHDRRFDSKIPWDFSRLRGK
jgi:hypothetical protein